jgi:hypothetical protein
MLNLSFARLPNQAIDGMANDYSDIMNGYIGHLRQHHEEQSALPMEIEAIGIGVGNCAKCEAMERK